MTPAACSSLMTRWQRPAQPAGAAVRGLSVRRSPEAGRSRLSPDMRGAPGPRTFTGRLRASLPQLSVTALARARNLPGFPFQLSLPGRFTLRIHFPWSTPHVSAVPRKTCRRRSRAAGTYVTIWDASSAVNSSHPGRDAEHPDGPDPDP